MLDSLHKDVAAIADKKKAVLLARFFKTGEGQYGAGDIFCGITVPQSRVIAAKYKDLPLKEISQLLDSKIHEERLITLIILVMQFNKSDEQNQKEIFDFYLAHTKNINNWDLVDLSTDKIVGEYLICIASNAKQSHTKEIAASSSTLHNDVLVTLAHSENLWEKRIAMVATFAFILHGESKTTFAIADMLLHDKHDLIQKAVGWMLREVGKRVSEKALIGYLQTRYTTMPRTTLRYAIERFPIETRKKYLAGTI